MAVYHPSHLSAELNIDKILSSHAKEFIASAEVNDLGQQYVELKMYDFLSFPWSLEKLRDYRDKQEEGTLEHYPYALLAEYAKDFIAAVKIDDQGNSYVELRMYDFLGMPLTDEEILESVEKEKRSIRPDYPCQTFSQYSLTIDVRGNEAEVSNRQSDCSE